MAKTTKHVEIKDTDLDQVNGGFFAYPPRFLATPPKVRSGPDLDGGEGNDLLIGSDGADVLRGGAGNDT